MKNSIGWLSDPIFHIIVIVLVVVGWAIGAGAGASTTGKASQPAWCDKCYGRHAESAPCP